MTSLKSSPCSACSATLERRILNGHGAAAAGRGRVARRLRPRCQVKLDHVIRFERAGHLLIHFNLYRRVADTEILVQFRRELRQQLVTRMTIRHQTMTGQCGFGSTHWPDMQIMNRGHARPSLEKGTDIVRLDAGRYGIQRHADGVTQQTPRPHQNNASDGETHERIEARPAGHQYYAGGYHTTDGHQCVIGHMKERGSKIDVALAARYE